MGSRLKINPDRTFNWFFEATCPITRDKDPGLSFQFPEDFSDEESREELPRFCFPYDIQRGKDRMAVQHFCFVLTDLEGCQRFGFCRLNNNTQTCLCILSYLPWFEVFYKLLNNLADYLTKRQTNEMKEMLAALYKQPMPLPAGSVTLQMGKQLLVGTEVSWPGHAPDGQDWVPYFIAPDPRSLPSIPENRNLTELVVAVDVANLLQLYASMLFERRVLLVASKLSTLTACVHALSGVLYPMYWQHIFIPVLPPHLLDYCCAPMPYLIGVHASLSERVRSRGLEEVVILNIDTNTLENPFDDLKRLPTDVMSGLKALLKRQTAAAGYGVAKAFLRAQAMLFGGYKDALQDTKEGEVWFSEELFLVHKSPAMTQFLQGAVHLQFFKQFIDERLELLNKGEEPDDLFEEEIRQCRIGGTTSYQQLVGNLKRGGGALILNMKSKANMKAKGFTKRGLKNLLIHKDHSETHALQRGGSVAFRRAQSDCLQDRLPITQHFGTSRPRRPGHKHRSSGEGETTEEDTRDAWDGAVTGPVAECDSDLQKGEGDGGESPLCDPEEMDLLGEIFETLSSRSSHECGLLYGTRSLDLFALDSHDYITKVPYRKKSLVTPSQESLSLSVGGSDSLHSWNLEEGLQATEAESDVTEDSDGLSLDACVPEVEPESLLVAGEPWMEETGPRECREEGKVKGDRDEVTEVPMNWTEEDINRSDSERVITEEVKEETGQQDMNVVAEELTVQGRIEKQEESKGLGANEAEDGGCREQVSGSAEEKRGTEHGVRRQNDLLREQNELKGVTESLSGNSETGDTQHGCHPDSVDVVVEYHQRQDDTANLDTTASPQPQNLAVDPDSKPSSVEEKTDGRQRENEEQEMERTPCPPKVSAAVTRFQSKSFKQILENRSQASSLAQSERTLDIPRGRAKSLTPSVTNDSTENEEVPQPVKVSELKKRFEAERLGK